MTNDIFNDLKKENLVEDEDVVLAGVSGGADSVCLLLLLEQLQKEVSFTLEAVHVEHGIRGEESRKDALFVERLCKEHGIVCHTYSVETPEYAKEHGLGPEEAARILRYDCYQEAAEAAGKRFPGKRVKLALAHHAQDNAETILFQMVRGSGIDGLCGMQLRIEREAYELIRPLLKQSRETIEAFLREKGQTYCTDVTNFDTDYSRNRIRHRVLPELTAINDRAVEHINRSAFLLQELREYVNAEVDRIYRKYVFQAENGLQLQKGMIDDIPEMIAGEVIHNAIENVAGSKKDITSSHIRIVKKLFFSQAGRSVKLPYRLVAERNYDGVLLKREEALPDKKEAFFVEVPQEQLEMLFEGEVLEFDVPGGRVRFRGFTFDGEINKISKKSYTKWLNYDKIKCGLQIRTRTSGDDLTIDDSGHTKKLKEYFINEKVPKEMRDGVLLLADGFHILWVVGQRIGADYKIDECTKRILEVQFFGGKYHESQEY